jgi:hypothetical protein
MKETYFGNIMSKAQGVLAPLAGAKNDEEEPKRTSSYPRRKGKA